MWSRWLEAGRVARDETFRRVDPAGVPARAGAADGVEGEAADHHPGVFGVGVDRDPLAGTGFAPGLEAGRVERAFQQAAAVQRVGDGAGAVVAGGFEGAVATAPDVRGVGDRVGRGDDLLYLRRRRRRGARFRFGDEAGLFARVQRRRGFGCHFGDDALFRRPFGRFFGVLGGDLFGDRGEVVTQRLFLGLQRVHRFAALGLGALQFEEARFGGFLGGGDFLLGGRDRITRAFDLFLGRGQPADRVLDFVAQRLDLGDDRVVVALDPVQVFGLRRHARPAFRFDDRVEHVG